MSVDNVVKHDAGDSRKYYTPQYPAKYKGTYPIVCRSQWERAFCMMVDTNVNVLQWASEPYKIPYSDPLTKTQKIYIPDFLISCKQQNGTVKNILIEVKPSHEATNEAALTDRDRLAVARNMAKWQAATWWCQRRGIEFKIMTEHDLFGPNYAPPKKKKAYKPKKPATAKKPKTARKRK